MSSKYIIIFLILREEKLLNFEETNFAQINEVRKAMEPYEKLWRTVSNFEKKSSDWLNSPYWKIDATQVESEVGDMYKIIHRLNKTFINQPSSLRVAQKLRVRQLFSITKFIRITNKYNNQYLIHLCMPILLAQKYSEQYLGN